MSINVEVDFMTTQERIIKTKNGQQLKINKGQRFTGQIIVWHNEEDLLEEWMRRHNDIEIEDSPAMISVRAHLRSNGKTYEYRNYLEYSDLHFRHGQAVSETSQIDFFGCPTLAWLVDSRSHVTLFIDGKKLSVREKYVTVFITFAIGIRDVFVKCCFYDADHLADYRTIYYKSKVEDILFLPIYTVYYERGKIEDIYRDSNNPIDLVVSSCG